MKRIAIIAITLLATTAPLFAQTGSASGIVAPDLATCSLQPKQVDTLLSLSVDKFDQDMGGGWREIARRGCELSAAMLIDSFILDAPPRMTTSERENLFFHAGQLYAFSNLRALSARHLLRAIHLHESASAELAWNSYVLATVAFLDGDRIEFDHQRQLLASSRATDGNKINLNVLEGLSKCFDKSYGEAYNNCRPSVH